MFVRAFKDTKNPFFKNWVWRYFLLCPGLQFPPIKSNVGLLIFSFFRASQGFKSRTYWGLKLSLIYFMSAKVFLSWDGKWEMASRGNENLLKSFFNLIDFRLSLWQLMKKANKIFLNLLLWFVRVLFLLLLRGFWLSCWWSLGLHCTVVAIWWIVSDVRIRWWALKSVVGLEIVRREE